jgi:predicted TIM-barrel fold metal-dependent hydrolase
VTCILIHDGKTYEYETEEEVKAKMAELGQEFNTFTRRSVDLPSDPNLRKEYVRDMARNIEKPTLEKRVKGERSSDHKWWKKKYKT